MSILRVSKKKNIFKIDIYEKTRDWDDEFLIFIRKLIEYTTLITWLLWFHYLMKWKVESLDYG